MSTTLPTPVPMTQKIAFGIGMFANQMFPAVLGIFMVVLVKDLGFPGWMWGVIYFLPRVFDCITDPIMGFISDNTKSRWGRRGQYVFVGAIITGISFIAMWQLYQANSINYNFTYFMLWSIVFYLGITIFSVPYVAMGYEMSNDFHERTNIMAIAQWIGQWAWVIAPWFWVIMYDPEWFPSAEVATRELAIWVGIACAIFAMVPAFLIKSKSTLNEDYSPLTLGNIGNSIREIIQGFIEAFKSKPFRKLAISTFFIYNSFYTIAAFSFFIVVYYLFEGDAAAAGLWPTLFGSIGALVTTFVVIPIVAKMSMVMGKKNAFLASQGISIIGYILLWFLFIPGKPYMFIFALPFFSFGIGSLFTLMMSMTADVIDLDELSSGQRREGVFGAIYWWMVKFGFAIAGGLSGVILSLVGFDSDIAIQTDEALTGLRASYSGLPILGTLYAMWVMRDYDLTEEKANDIREELDRRKNPKPKSSSYYLTDKLRTISGATLAHNLGTDINFTSNSTKEIQEIFKETLNTGIHGICFNPYVEGQNIGVQLSEIQIARRIDAISPYTKWVRSFSCLEGNEFIPIIAKQIGLNTMVGAWIGDDRDENEKQLQALIQLAKQGHVDIAVIGNEVLLREEVSDEEILIYINKFKAEIPNIPIGYVDAYYKLLENPKIIEACDVILINCYPFWEGCNVEQSSAYLKHMYDVAKKSAQGKPVIITETGWPNKGANTAEAVPSSENAMKYFINVNKWAAENNIDMFYFSSFDESWKVHHEGDVGARWGLWDKNEKLKYT